jgi:hypothetical protein
MSRGGVGDTSQCKFPCKAIFLLGRKVKYSVINCIDYYVLLVKGVFQILDKFVPETYKESREWRILTKQPPPSQPFQWFIAFLEKLMVTNLIKKFTNVCNWSLT